MSTDVEPRFKTNVGDCGCGCGVYGTLRVKPWSSGTRCVRRGCSCASCRGRRSKRKGGVKQAAAARAMGIPRSSLSPGHEEFLGGTVRIEVKAGAQAGPVWTRFRLSEEQSEAARSVGDHRPFAAVFAPDGTRRMLVVVDLAHVQEFAAAIVEQWGGGVKPHLLDLFSGAGGATRGYQMAGFHVTGVDLADQPHYIGDEFHQADAMTFPLDGFDAIHASPVCHDWSPLATITGTNGTGRLLLATLDRLRDTAVPWVVENVSRAPLPRQSDLFGRHGVELCGTMFGLRVIRHRLFETSFSVAAPLHGSHEGEFYAPAGHGDPNWKRREANPHRQGKGYTDRCRRAMGVDWMTPGDASTPPAHGHHLKQEAVT